VDRDEGGLGAPKYARWEEDVEARHYCVKVRNSSSVCLTKSLALKFIVAPLHGWRRVAKHTDGSLFLLINLLLRFLFIFTFYCYSYSFSLLPFLLLFVTRFSIFMVTSKAQGKIQSIRGLKRPNSTHHHPFLP
jgi:hypothetical protein